MDIIFPTVITGTSLSSCTVTISGTTSSPTCTVTATSPFTVKITGAFTTAYTATTTPFTVTLGGLRNPRTTAITSSFTVSTTDSSGYSIASLSTGITTQMTTVPDITTFTVAPASGINGATNDYTITVTSPIPHYSTDKLVFTFPSEVVLPVSVSCSTVSSLTAVSCSNSG